jgi:hypothetical protein
VSKYLYQRFLKLKKIKISLKFYDWWSGPVIQLFGGYKFWIVIVG